MVKKLMGKNVKYYINGYQQIFVESLTPEYTRMDEILQLLESPYQKHREIKDDGTGEITFILSDADDGYGPHELLGYLLGYNDYDTVTNTWTITDMDLTIDPTSNNGDMLRYLVDRQDDDTGTTVTVTFGGSASTTMTYTTRGKELDKICLDIVSETVGGNARLSVQSTASTDTAYIRNSDLDGASGKTWFTLYNIGETATASITTYSATHDSLSTDTLTLTIIDGVGSETIELDRNLVASNLWHMVRMWNQNHLDIEIRYYDDGGVNYIYEKMGRVWMTGSTLSMEPLKAPRATLRFMYEEMTFGTG